MGTTATALSAAAASGPALREYRIAPGQSVACTAAPEDDYVVVRLALDAGPSDEVDVETEMTPRGAAPQESLLANVAIDRARGDVVYMFSADYVRGLPRSRWVMFARVRAGSGERRLGPYVMEHTPWDELPEGSA